MLNEKDCHVDPIQKDSTPEERAEATVTQLAIGGMGCPNCAYRVQNSILTLHGVIDAQVNHLTGAATVRYNPAMVTTEQLVQAVTLAGGDGRHEYFAQPTS